MPGGGCQTCGQYLPGPFLLITSHLKLCFALLRHIDPACRVRLYCKGADNIIYGLLAPGQALEQPTQPHLAEMARSGLRTLCIAHRDISAESYEVGPSSACQLTAENLNVSGQLGTLVRMQIP